MEQHMIELRELEKRSKRMEIQAKKINMLDRDKKCLSTIQELREAIIRTNKELPAFRRFKEGVENCLRKAHE